MAELHGLPAVLDQMDPTGEPPAPEAEQLDLLGLPERCGYLGSQPPRGRGRPPGARNKRTVEWAEYLTTRYGSPLEVLAQIATSSVAELHVLLSCTPIEALAEKRLAAIALLPYVHQRMPLSVDLTNRQLVHLTINEGASGDARAAAGVAMTLTGHVVDIMENQELNEGPDGPV